MIVLLSPAKALQINRNSPSDKISYPVFHEEANKIIAKLRTYSKSKLQSLMNISDKLVELNYQRYLTWNNAPDNNQANHAIISFNGEVYNGLKAFELSAAKLDFAQKHVRILSGVYGWLRPLDLIQEYRLEMGTKLKLGRADSLYDLWMDKITGQANTELQEYGYNTVINLASNEYFKAINTKDLNARIITLSFKEERDGKYKSIFMYIKKARGLMTRFLIDNEITEPEDLKAFDAEGYYFNPALSDDDNWTFCR